LDLGRIREHVDAIFILRQLVEDTKERKSIFTITLLTLSLPLTPYGVKHYGRYLTYIMVVNHLSKWFAVLIAIIQRGEKLCMLNSP